MNCGLDDLLSEWVSLNSLTPDQIAEVRDVALQDRVWQFEITVGIIKMQYEIIRENFSFMTKPWWIQDDSESA